MSHEAGFAVDAAYVGALLAGNGAERERDLVAFFTRTASRIVSAFYSDSPTGFEIYCQLARLNGSYTVWKEAGIYLRCLYAWL